MNEDKVDCVRRKDFRRTLTRNNEINRNHLESQDAGVQYNWRRDNGLCCTDTRFLLRSSSSTDIYEGNKKKIRKENIGKSHLLQSRDRGVGSADLTDYIVKRPDTFMERNRNFKEKCYLLKKDGKAITPTYVKFDLNENLPINNNEHRTPIWKESTYNTSLKNIEIASNVVPKKQISLTNLNKSDDITNEEENAITTEVSEPTSSEKKSNQTGSQMKVAQFVVMSQGDTGRDILGDKSEDITNLVNTKVVSGTPLVKICDKVKKSTEKKKKGSGNKTDNSSSENKFPTVKTSSVFRRPFEALRRTFGNKDSKNNSRKSVHVLEVTNSKIENHSYEQNRENASIILESLRGKKVHFKEQPTEITAPILIEKSLTEKSVENKRSRKLFFFKNKKPKNKVKSAEDSKHNDRETNCQYKVHRLTVSFDGDVNFSNKTIPNIKPITDHPTDSRKELTRKTWLMECLNGPIESKNSVKVRWNNKKYNTSSSTVTELVENIYQDSGIIFPSKSEILREKTSSYRSLSSPKVVFPQNFQTWATVPAIMSDQQPLMVVNRKRTPKGQSENINVSISDQKWYIDKSKAFTHDIKVIIHSKNFLKHSNANLNSEYLKIDIPKDFFADETSSRDHTSEEVNNIIEYNNFKSGSEIKTALDTGDHHASKDIYLTVSVKDKLCESKVFHTVIKTSNQRDVVTQGNDVFVPKKCNVIGVGILTQRNIGEVKNKSILKILEYETDGDGSDNNVLQQRGYAESYLKDIYKNFTPLDIDLFSWCVGDSGIPDCIETNRNLNSGDGLSFKIIKSVNSDNNRSKYAPITSYSATSCTAAAAKIIKNNLKIDTMKKTCKKDCKYDMNMKNMPVNCYPCCGNLPLLHKDSVYVSRKRLLFYNNNKSKWRSNHTDSTVGVSTEALDSSALLDKLYQGRNKSKQDDIDIHSSVVTKTKKKSEPPTKQLSSREAPGILTYVPRHDIQCKTCAKRKTCSKTTHMASDVVEKELGCREQYIQKKHSYSENISSDCQYSPMVHPLICSSSSACRFSVEQFKTKTGSSIHSSSPAPVSVVTHYNDSGVQTYQGPKFPCLGCKYSPRQTIRQAPIQSPKHSIHSPPSQPSDNLSSEQSHQISPKESQSPSPEKSQDVSPEKSQDISPEQSDHESINESPDPSSPDQTPEQSPSDTSISSHNEQLGIIPFSEKQNEPNGTSQESVNYVGRVASTVLSNGNVSIPSSQKELQLKKKSNVTFDKSVTVLDTKNASEANLIEINIRLRPAPFDRTKETLQLYQMDKTTETHESNNNLAQNIVKMIDTEDLPGDGQDDESNSKDVNITIFVKNLYPENREDLYHKENDSTGAEQLKSIIMNVGDPNDIKVNPSKSKIGYNLPTAEIEICSKMLEKANFKMKPNRKPHIKVVVPTKVNSYPKQHEILSKSKIHDSKLLVGQFTTSKTDFNDQERSDVSRVTDERTNVDNKTAEVPAAVCNNHVRTMNVAVSIHQKDSHLYETIDDALSDERCSSKSKVQRVMNPSLEHHELFLAKQKMKNTVRKLDQLLKSFPTTSYKTTPDQIMTCRNEVADLHDCVVRDAFFKSCESRNGSLILNTLPLENKRGFQKNYDITEESPSYYIDEDCNSLVRELKMKLLTNESHEWTCYCCNKSNKDENDSVCDSLSENVPSFLKNKITTDVDPQTCYFSDDLFGGSKEELLYKHTAVNIDFSNSENMATKVDDTPEAKDISRDNQAIIECPEMPKTLSPRTCCTKQNINKRSDNADDDLLECLETTYNRLSTVPKCFKQIQERYKHPKGYRETQDIIKEPEDALQLYETKKAVLEIYAEKKTQDDKKTKAVPKLPKFVFDGEIEISDPYERVAKSSSRKVKTAGN